MIGCLFLQKIVKVVNDPTTRGDHNRQPLHVGRGTDSGSSRVFSRREKESVGNKDRKTAI